MRYSIERKYQIYDKGYEFLSFAKNMGKNLSSKYGTNILDTTKKSENDVLQNASKRAIQKMEKAAGDLVGD